MMGINTTIYFAATCYPDGGRAVWQARGKCRYHFFEWYEEEGCMSPSSAPSAVNTEVGVHTSISLQPNPTGDVTCLYLGEIWSEVLTDIRVVNQMGQEMWYQRMKPTANDCIQLPSNAWSQGTYYVRVTSGTHNATQKLIINR
jgi:hypothetical protein